MPAEHSRDQSRKRRAESAEHSARSERFFLSEVLPTPALPELSDARGSEKSSENNMRELRGCHESHKSTVFHCRAAWVRAFPRAFTPRRYLDLSQTMSSYVKFHCRPIQARRHHQTFTSGTFTMFTSGCGHMHSQVRLRPGSYCGSTWIRQLLSSLARGATETHGATERLESLRE